MPEPSHAQTFRCSLRISGMGPESAKLAADALISDGVDALISFGTCAGLAPGLRHGALIVASEVIGEGVTFAADSALSSTCLAHTNGLIVHNGVLASVAEALTGVEQKRALHQSTGALGVDMETLAIARAAGAVGLPWVAIRAVCDPCEVSLPLWMAQTVGEPGWRDALAGLVKAPGSLASLIRVAIGFAAARRSLGAAAVAVGLGPTA